VVGICPNVPFAGMLDGLPALGKTAAPFDHLDRDCHLLSGSQGWNGFPLVLVVLEGSGALLCPKFPDPQGTTRGGGTSLVAHRHGENASRGIIVGHVIKFTCCPARAPQIRKFELDCGLLGLLGNYSGLGCGVWRQCTPREDERDEEDTMPEGRAVE
jgi:hypothetical protein